MSWTFYHLFWLDDTDDDNDGTPDSHDTDDDGDGVPDEEDEDRDTDGDGTPDIGEFYGSLLDNAPNKVYTPKRCLRGAAILKSQAIFTMLNIYIVYYCIVSRVMYKKRINNDRIFFGVATSTNWFFQCWANSESENSNDVYMILSLSCRSLPYFLYTQIVAT